MKRTFFHRLSFFTSLIFFLLLALTIPLLVEASPNKTVIYDDAGLFSEDEISKLTDLSRKLSKKRETDFIILTTSDPDGPDIIKYMQDFYDEKAFGYDKKHGNAAILTIDMHAREIYLAGFYKAETYLDDGRLDLIRHKITPYLSDGQYFKASQLFIKTASKYMGVKLGVDPDNILFKLSFQITVSLIVGILIVLSLVIRTGGRVTVNSGTYIDNKTSRIIDQRDQYIRTTVTKVKKPSSNNNSSGGSFSGGGGGFTGGGHSHSGSRGGF